MASLKTSNKTSNATVCPISRAHFNEHGPAACSSVRGKLAELAIDAKEFSTGSFGYNATDKITVMIGNEPVKCQVSVNVTVIGSKDAK